MLRSGFSCEETHLNRINWSSWRRTISLVLMAIVMPTYRSIADEPFTPVAFEQSAEWIDQNQLRIYVEAAASWNTDIESLSRSNASDGSSEAVLCIGSSSFRLWDSIAQDMAPNRIVRRAYGGAKFCDLAVHAPRLVRDLQYRSAMVFVGNDISGAERDKTPAEIKRLAKIVVETIQLDRTDIHVYLVAITPTPSRFKVWPEIRKANECLNELSQEMPRVHFVQTEHEYLNTDCQPRAELFQQDMLHQNERGYQQWSRLLKEALETE
jgi:hypothetical protein